MRRRRRYLPRLLQLLRPAMQPVLRFASSLLAFIVRSLGSPPPAESKAESRNAVDVRYVAPGQSSKP